MDTERWQRISPLLDELLELSPEALASRLAELRDREAELAAELEALIALEDGSEDFLSEPAMSPQRGVLPGTSVGPYRLERLLGEGGMGQVWQAARADGLYERRVALKLLRPGLADTNLRLRFTRERQILARLAHPHIARLLDAGISGDGLPYLALEYVDGAPITDYCRDHHVDLETRLRMFGQICDAVSHAHANLIVHRDLKPSNILVTPAGDVRLLDFGIAKLLDSELMPEQTRTGVRAFTLHYAAPEQIRGEPVSTMTDVYSLGVVLYELLADTKPYRPTRASDAAWEEAILAQDPLRPSQAALQPPAGAAAAGHDVAARRRHARNLAGDLDNIVLKALSKRAERRYPSVEALAQDLRRYALGRPVHARPQSLGYRLRKYLRRHRWSLATATLTSLVIAAALSIVAWQAREAVREAARAKAMQDFMIGVFDGAGGARGGEPLNLRDLLALSIDRGNRELTQQPRALAELHGVVARARIGLGDYEEARALLDRQAGLIVDADDVPTSLRLEALTQRGRVARLLGDGRRCIDLMQPSLDSARREQSRLPAQATEFYSQLGRCRRANGEPQLARVLFERSLELRRDTGTNRVGVVENLMDLAGLHADVGETATALADFEAARAQLRATAGGRHPLLIDIHRNLARLHRARGGLEQAERELRAAVQIALEVHGPQHTTTLETRRQLADIHIDRGHFAAANAELRENHRQLLARPEARPEALAESHRQLGLVQWQRGDISAAVDSLTQALALRRADGRTGAIAAALFDMGAVLHASHRDRAARPILVEARRLRRERYGGGHWLVGDTDRVLGEVEARLGFVGAGDQRLASALRLLRAALGREHPTSRQAQLALAYHRAREFAPTVGAAKALVELDELAGLSTGDMELRDTAWRARAYAAQLRCHGPGRATALQQLGDLDAALRDALPEGGAVRREVEGIRDGCADEARALTAR